VQGSLLIQAINRHTSCLEGHNPIPSALSCTFLRPTGGPPQSSRETGEPREFPSPYIPLGLQLGLESSTWVFPAGTGQYFCQASTAVIRVRTWVLRLGGERLNHYATCLTSRRTSAEHEEEEEEWAGARELVDSSYQPTYVVLEGHNPIPSALSCTFLPANRRPPQSSRETGEPRDSRPLHPLGLQLGLESSTWVFPDGTGQYFCRTSTL